MSTEPASQRAFRAACPNCGAPVDFRSPASPFAVCSFCHSTVMREGEALRKIGESAEVFDDHSPLRLGAAGTYQGARFVLVGRLQYQYADGTWNEWHALFESGPGFQKSGWLSEDNGRYVIAFDAPLEGAVPASAALNVGAPLTVNGQSWVVASVTEARLGAAQGELPKAPQLSRAFSVADLRSSRGEVGTLDYTNVLHPAWSVGTSVALSALAMTGLSEAASEKTLKGKGFECPNCGAALAVKLDTTQSIVCSQCKSVIDVSKGVGADMAHYAQANGMEPLLKLGSVGTLALSKRGEAWTPLPWQVVGYVERIEVESIGSAADDDDDSSDGQSAWREYLLYNRTEGFAFVVDAEDGWSWSAPITGVPEKVGTSVKLDGVLYKKLYAYGGEVTYVLGEFYWRLAKSERTQNIDYQGTGGASASRLYREETASVSPTPDGDRNREVVWSRGAALPAETVLGAFRIGSDQFGAFKRDAGLNAFSTSTLGKVFFWIFVVIVVLALFRCGDDSNGAADCEQTRESFGDASTEYQSCLNNHRGGSGYRTGGGAFGGFSSGGAHK